jgi:hypothetical protein
VHHHGYLWAGPKERFDQEALRRPAHPDPPPVGSRPELVQRHQEVVAGFPGCDLPPLEAAYWLVKPRSLVRGTWATAEAAAEWLGDRMDEYERRFLSVHDRDAPRLAARVESAAVRLGTGADVSYGFYLERPAYLHLAVVTCSPNRSRPGLGCPVGQVMR